ncbi:MAG: signal recognition particle protein, partial [Eubacteriales bacterium]|nr:signal recognition particle protein [Eubacteriales bacterium]
VLTLIEKAEAEIDQDKAKEMEQKFRKAEFDFNDFLDQMEQMKKMGGIQSILSMMPGMGLPADLDVDDSMFQSIEAIIYSMTLEERGNPSIINPSRKRRIAKGAGVDISEVNKLMKQYEQSKKMMKQMSGLMGGKGKRRGRMGGMPKLPFGF